MAGISGSRTLSPDVLEAIRTKSYVLRPVVKVRIVFCCESSNKRRYLTNSDLEIKIESNLFRNMKENNRFCDHFYEYDGTILLTLPQDRTSREKRRAIYNHLHSCSQDCDGVSWS